MESTIRNEVYIGIDGGGTKTRIVAADEHGNILGQFVGLGTNVADIGFQECERRLNEYLLQVPYQNVRSVYAGLAGSANEKSKAIVKEILKRLLPNACFVDNGTDALSPLYAEADEGIVLIAGTGSSVFVVSDGVTVQVGGWGSMIDDAGSGYRIGADVLKAAYRDLDGRGYSTLLTSLCEKRLGMVLSKAIPTIYTQGKTYIASFAPLAFEAAKCGDALAIDIVKNAADEIALHLKVCLRYVEKRPAVTVLNGGLTDNLDYLAYIEHALGDDRNQFRLIKPNVPPVYGALVKALHNAGIRADDSFREIFLKGVQI